MKFFKAVLSSAIFYGPIRGYKQVEIFCGDTRIIMQKTGSQGFGSNYFQGEKFFFEGNKAYLIVRGHEMKYDHSESTYLDLDPEKYYLFIFSNITLTTTYPAKKINQVVEKDEYFEEEIEIYRQKEWGGYLSMANTVLHAESSAVEGFYWHKNADGKDIYKRFPFCNSLTKIKIAIGEDQYLFESI